MSDADSGVGAGTGDGVADRLHRRLSPSTRSLAGRYAVVVVLVFLVVAAGGGYLTYDVQTAPETRFETQTVGTWEPDVGFSHSAVVSNTSIVFDRGQRLSERELYFTRISPVLDGQYRLSHSGDADAATGRVDLRLVLQATEEVDTEDGETETVTYWRQIDPLASEEIERLPPGETHIVQFETNATELTNRLDRIEEDLGASPGTREIVVVADTTFEAEVEGERFTDERTDRLRLEPDGGTYSVDSEVDSSEPYEATATVEVPVEHAPAELYGGPALVVLGLLGALGVGGLTHRGAFAVSPAERRRLTFQRAREDYDEWISRGALPDESADRVIELDSLEDVVNTAIDSDRRVVERVEPTPRYATVVDDIEYRFDPPDVVAEAVSPAPEGGIDVAVGGGDGADGSAAGSDPDTGSDADDGDEPAGEGSPVRDGDGDPGDP
jgi:hypothetical protein